MVEWLHVCKRLVRSFHIWQFHFPKMDEILPDSENKNTNYSISLESGSSYSTQTDEGTISVFETRSKTKSYDNVRQSGAPGVPYAGTTGQPSSRLPSQTTHNISPKIGDDKALYKISLFKIWQAYKFSLILVIFPPANFLFILLQIEPEKEKFRKLLKLFTKWVIFVICFCVFYFSFYHIWRGSVCLRDCLAFSPAPHSQNVTQTWYTNCKNKPNWGQWLDKNCLQISIGPNYSFDVCKTNGDSYSTLHLPSCQNYQKKLSKKIKDSMSTQVGILVTGFMTFIFLMQNIERKVRDKTQIKKTKIDCGDGYLTFLRFLNNVYVRSIYRAIWYPLSLIQMTNELVYYKQAGIRGDKEIEDQDVVSI